jgi:hypothetical protein
MHRLLPVSNDQNIYNQGIRYNVISVYSIKFTKTLPKEVQAHKAFTLSAMDTHARTLNAKLII